MAQKASFSDKVIILFLEAKIVELKDKLKDIDLERTYHDLNVIEGMIEKPAQINSFNPKEIDSLRLELKQMKKDLNSKEYIIEYMKKGIESSNSIFRQKIDILSSARLNLLEKNTHLQELLLKKDNEIDTLLPPMNDLS